MVAYSDVGKVTALHDEQNRIIQGMTLIDNGGTVSSFTIVPPPPDPQAMNTMMMMSVSIMTIAPTPALMQAVRDAMTARSTDITAELLALGVTDPPPDPVPPVRSAPAAGATGAVAPAAAAAPTKR